MTLGEYLNANELFLKEVKVKNIKDRKSTKVSSGGSKIERQKIIRQDRGSNALNTWRTLPSNASKSLYQTTHSKVLLDDDI